MHHSALHPLPVTYGPPVPLPAPGFYPDPWWSGQSRWWDGRAWTPAVQPLQDWTLRRPPRLFGVGSIVAFSITGVLGALLLLLNVGVAPFLLASLVALLPLPLYAAATLAFDRFHPEPWPALLWAFLAGGTVVTFAAAILNDLGSLAFELVLGEAAGTVLGSSLVAPVVEETGKALVLVVLFLRYRRQAGGLLSGLVYASMAGLGFATFENVLYYGAALADGDIAAAFVMRGILSPFAHPLFAAMFGIGFALYRERPEGWRRFAPFLGLTAGILLHGLWNGSTMVLGGWGFFLVFFALMVPAFAGMIVLAILAGRRERHLVAQHLGPEVHAGILAPADVSTFSTIGERRRLVAAARRYHPEAGRAARDLAVSLAELAFARDRLARGLPPQRLPGERRNVELLQERVWAARRALPPPLPHAPWAGLSGPLHGLPAPYWGPVPPTW